MDSKPLCDWKEIEALCEWSGVDISKCSNELELSGATRNVLRYAEQWGPKLIAMLAVENLIGSDGSPEDALYRLIDDKKY